MISGGSGAHTITGLQFERQTDVLQLFRRVAGYEIRVSADGTGDEIWFLDQYVARWFKRSNCTVF